ncbi:hypothetical protein RQP46_004298 [Phenoliferia psychrophenolica]
MGICSDRFITSVAEHLICPVCFDVLDNPHRVCAEEHTYCKACVGNANDGCPTCRAPRDPAVFQPARHLARVIGEFELTCAKKELGCPWTGPCIYRDVACTNSVFGCDIKVQFRNLATHVNTECKHETIECPRGGVDCGGPGHGRYQRSAPKPHGDVCLKWKCRVTPECATTGSLAMLVSSRLSFRLIVFSPPLLRRKHTNPAAKTCTAVFRP